MFTFFMVFLTFSMSVWAQNMQDLKHWPENYETREFYSSFFSKQDLVELPPKQNYRQRIGKTQVLFEARMGQNSINFYFINESKGSFKSTSAGNYIIFKDYKTMLVSQIRIYLGLSDDSYIDIIKTQNSSLFNLKLFGTFIERNVNIPLSIEKIATLSFHDLRDYTSRTIDWSLLTPNDSREYAQTFKIIDEIKSKTGHFPEVFDGGIDADGNMVYINDLKPQSLPYGLNYAGFTKWIADGFYKNITNKYLRLGDLKERHLDYRNSETLSSVEYSMDPYYGLDWTRNIGLILNQEILQKEVSTPEAYDVRNIPYFQYSEDRGYRTEYLKNILFFLSKKESGYMYFLSISSPTENSKLIQHRHVAVAFPQFNEDGKFEVSLGDINGIYPLESLEKRFPSSFTHLVRVKIPGTPFSLKKI